MSRRLVVVHPTAEHVARAAGLRLLLTLLDAQSVHRPVHVALTGGGMGSAMLGAVRDEPLLGAVDWTGVHVWWGDERFLPAGHPQRNETQARAALLDALGVPAGNVHPVPGPDRAATPEAAAEAYAAELRSFAPAGAPAGAAAGPDFAVVVLGVGADGHVASLFPGKDTVTVTDRLCLAELDSPKPPPQRVSLTLPALSAAEQVWLVVSGPGKAPAVAAALGGGVSPEVPRAPAPAGLVAGRRLTLWLLDVDAAGAFSSSDVPGGSAARPAPPRGGRRRPRPNDVP